MCTCLIFLFSILLCLARLVAHQSFHLLKKMLLAVYTKRWANSEDNKQNTDSTLRKAHSFQLLNATQKIITEIATIGSHLATAPMIEGTLNHF